MVEPEAFTVAGFKEVKGALTSYRSTFSSFKLLCSAGSSGFPQATVKPAKRIPSTIMLTAFCRCNKTPGKPISGFVGLFPIVNRVLILKPYPGFEPAVRLGPDLAVKIGCVEDVVHGAKDTHLAVSWWDREVNV